MSDSLIFADTDNDRIMRLSLADLNIYFLVANAGGTRFSEGIDPLAMAPLRPRVVDYNPITGKIFFVEGSSSRVLYIDAAGKVRLFAGTGANTFSGDGGPATAAGLSDPRAITVDSRGNAYIADDGNHADPHGRRRRPAVGGGSTIRRVASEAGLPSWLAVGDCTPFPFAIAGVPRPNPDWPPRCASAPSATPPWHPRAIRHTVRERAAGGPRSAYGAGGVASSHPVNAAEDARARGSAARSSQELLGGYRVAGVAFARARRMETTA